MSYFKFKILDDVLTSADYCGFTLKSMYLYGKTSDGHLCASSGLTRCDDPSEDTYSMKIYVKNKNSHSFKNCWTPIWVPVDPLLVNIITFDHIADGKECFDSWIKSNDDDRWAMPSDDDWSHEADENRCFYFDGYLEYLSNDYCNWSCFDNEPTAIQLLAWKALEGSDQLQSVRKHAELSKMTVQYY